MKGIIKVQEYLIKMLGREIEDLKDVIFTKDILINLLNNDITELQRELQILRDENDLLMIDTANLRINDDMIHDHYDSITDRIDELDSTIIGLIKCLKEGK